MVEKLKIWKGNWKWVINFFGFFVNFFKNFFFLIFWFFIGHYNSQFLRDNIVLNYEAKIFTKIDADIDRVGEAREDPDKENPPLKEPLEGRGNILEDFTNFVSQNTFFNSLFENIRNCKRLVMLMIFLAVFAYILQNILSIAKNVEEIK